MGAVSMLLLTATQLSWLAIATCILTQIFCGSVVCNLMWPLAMVTETFEYDVLRALNNPLILRNAQRFFGQQLLPHLTTLEWGFRVCGNTITSKSVMNVVLALVITLTTGVSQA